ncbi:ubiquitin ligase subunit CulD [Nemania sp. FL0916]|nr:ubiquitin ligase subunit CulD [Nemania sp. FL0916]
MSSTPNIPPEGRAHSNTVIPSKRRSFDFHRNLDPDHDPDSDSPYRDGKRPRTTGSGPGACEMSKALGKRPATMARAFDFDIDIDDRPKHGRTAFEPHHGAKKLVVTRLRTAPPPAALEHYYERKHAELSTALVAIFQQQPPRQPLETLYRGVEDICRHGDARALVEVLRSQCESHLDGPVRLSIMDGGGSSNVDMLRSVHKHWVVWNAQSTIIRSVFSYLDRSFLLNNKDFQQINDMAIALFRKTVFVSIQQSSLGPGAKSLAGICDLVDYDRRGDPRFDPALLHDAISMLKVLNIYTKSFEHRFLKTSSVFLHSFAEELSASSLKIYISACEKLLTDEDHRCNVFNFDSTTKRQLMNEAHVVLINNYSTKLLDSGSISKLLDENSVDSMKALYDLLRLSSLQEKLKGPWEDYIKTTGSAIINDSARGDEVVVRLLEFRKALDIVVRDAFQRDSTFAHGLRQAFDSFINDKKAMASQNTGTSRVGEMIAKHIDMLLRGGLKTLPPSLLSDVQDRADAEKSGLASTGDEDAELDRQLDRVLELFRFIEGKSVFEAFYKQDLARRLLMGRSASADAERSMLAKLKSECGSDFTRNLEQMFKDQQMARDEMASYKAWREGTRQIKTKLDLQVSILSAAAWPTYPDTQLILPYEVASQHEQYEAYYVNKHTGRRLTWKHSLAHCVVKASFKRGPKELLVSAYQAVVLTLFNHAEDPLSYQQIAERSGLSGRDLDRTLQSLACGKVRVITKIPKGKEVNPSDKFVVNEGFSDPKVRIKINQIQLKETKEENKDTHERVARDRQFETQAAIVRIMKSRKTMTHANLVAEVINQTKKRGAVEPAEIKKNIEKLIEKDYIEREGSSYTYLA